MHPALDVAVCPSHGEALHVHVASDPSSAGHGHHRECLRCLVAELYEFRDGARRDPAPDAYEAAGQLQVSGLVVALEDQAGARWPLAVLLEDLVGRRVRIHIAPEGGS